ncbi:hypothetical protein Q7A53_05860 [Halobacillus rhizosphaerae]|uniref:hypothetical protein n=1 Tax=Halobacillus rhizosphaerae TaxID=3064889 RepID=UPI00398A65DD
MDILREVFFTQECRESSYIFINDNGDQVKFEGEEKVKESLLFLKGKALIPTSIEKEVKEEHRQEHNIFTASNGISVTFTKNF